VRLRSPRDRRRVGTRIEKFSRGLTARVGRKSRVKVSGPHQDLFPWMFCDIYDVVGVLMLKFHVWVGVNIYMVYVVLIRLI
jgi:hypothetical protein